MSEYPTSSKNVKDQTGAEAGPGPVSEKIKKRWQRLRESEAAEKKRNAQLLAWLKGGSDDLRDAWVSVCSYAATHDVQDFKLVDIVEAIRQGNITVDTRWSGPEVFDLVKHQATVRQLYLDGVAEAKETNTATIKGIVEALELKVDLGSVKLVYFQPKESEKRFLITHLKVGREEYEAPEGYLYIKPEVLGKKKADEAKKQTPGVVFAALFKPRRKADRMLRSTGLYPLDFDGVRDLDAALEVIRADPNVVIVFISITGSGLKVCVRGPSARNATEYSENYERIAALKSRAWGLQAEIDRPNKDCSRLCFMAYDPEVVVNWSAVALTLEDLPRIDQNKKPESKTSASKKKATGTTKAAGRVQERGQSSDGLPLEIDWGDVPKLNWKDIPLARCLDAMRYIEPCCGREPWRIVGAGLKLGFGDEAFPFFNTWSSHGGAAYSGTEDCQKLWDGHKRSDDGTGNVVTPKSILKLAWNNGWKPACQRPQFKAADGIAPETEIDGRGRIVLPMFGAGLTPGDFCSALYDHMAKSGKAYIRGGQVSHLVDDPEVGTRIEKVDPASMVTWIENFAQVYITDDEGNKRPASINEKACRIIVKAADRYKLSPLESVVEAPVLCEINGQPKFLEAGYNRDLHLFVVGKHRLPDVKTLTGAVNNILSIVKHYDFATPSDKSRAIAALLTPEFKLGRFIKGHVPMTLFEADASLSGKSKLAESVAACYGERPALIAQRKRGVGSVDESIGNAMMKGRPFIVLDNWRGDLDSQFLECILTGGGRVDARALRTASDVDTNRYIFAVTSNGMSTTKDLCNRVSIVRINHRQGYGFPLFAEGSLPSHIRANFTLYLASIYLVVLEWLERGRPRTQEARHNFIEWAGVLDWVVLHIFNLPSLLDGHAETLKRVEHPDLAVLRQLCLELEKRERLDCTLRANALGDIALAAHIDLGHGAAASEDGAAMSMGKIMANSFAALGENDQGVIQFEGFHIRRRGERIKRRDGLGTKQAWLYQFARSSFVGKWPDETEPLPPEY